MPAEAIDQLERVENTHDVPAATTSIGRVLLVVAGGLASVVLIAAGMVSLLGTDAKGSGDPGRTAPRNQLVGAAAPTFRLPSVAAGTVASPWGAHHGTVLLFFADWCAPCHRELPAIAPILRAGRFGSVRVLGVDGDPSRGTAASFARAMGLRIPVAWDGDAALASSLVPAGFPASVVVGADGTVRDVHYGSVSPHQLREQIALARGAPHRR